jgi:DNA/RNA-binding domain of Phe-tRNA-synthetase-like protein
VRVSPSAPPAPEGSGGGFAPVPGWCAQEVERELPGLRLLVTQAQVARRGPLTSHSPPDVLARLRELSNRMRGATAVQVRRQPVPSAYRVFFRHIGLDPDVVRTPIEAAALERMLRGGYPSRGLLEDVLRIALIDTGVPVWALDADTVEGPLGIRTTGAGEHLGRRGAPPALPEGRLVIADASSPLAVLFGELAPGHRPARATRRLALFAVQVAGVPELYAEEALWSATAALELP